MLGSVLTQVAGHLAAAIEKADKRDVAQVELRDEPVEIRAKVS